MLADSRPWTTYPAAFLRLIAPRTLKSLLRAFKLYPLSLFSGTIKKRSFELLNLRKNSKILEIGCGMGQDAIDRAAFSVHLQAFLYLGKSRRIYQL
jgi:tRNA G46 methylase TrmB